MYPEGRWWGASIPDISYSFLSVLVLMAAYALQYKRFAGGNEFFEIPAFKWMLALLGCYLAVYFVALDPQAHWRETYWFLKLVIVVALAFRFLNSEMSLKLATWFYIIGVSYIGYVAYGTGRNRGARLEGIGTVDSPDSNGIAAALAPAVVLLIYYAWMGTKTMRAVAVVCAAFVVNALILINSRGAFVAVVVGAGFFMCYMIFSRYQKRFQRPFAFAVIICGAIGAYSLTDDAFWERMFTLTQYDDGAASGSHRTEFWMATFDMVQDHPLGLGIRGYNKVSRFYLDPEKYGDKNKSVHSSWFQVLSEVGWLGIILFCFMLYACFRTSWAARRHLAENQKVDEYFFVVALEAALITFLVAATFVNRGRAEILYWMLLFVSSSSSIYYLRGLRQREQSTVADIKGYQA